MLRLGDLSSQRDWGYAPEYVEAMVLMMQQERPDDYVIATGKTTSIEDFVELCFKIAGLDYKEHVVIDDKFKRPNDVKYLLGDASKAAAALGWKPKHTMSDIAAKMVNADIADLWNRGPDNRKEN
jgi:GDPmannose 4,6-dehydratase